MEMNWGEDELEFEVEDVVVVENSKSSCVSCSSRGVVYISTFPHQTPHLGWKANATSSILEGA